MQSKPTTRTLRHGLVLFAGSLPLAACALFGAGKHRPDPAEAVATVTAIRTAGARFDSSVQVQPLGDPAVDDLLRDVRRLESLGKPEQALSDLRRALTVTPDAPDLLQYEAELLIETGAWAQAATAARESYDLGPKVGALCARNLETLARVNAALGSDVSHPPVASCRVPPVPRF